MKDSQPERSFFDSNVLIYSISQSGAKSATAQDLLEAQDVVISTQALGEFANVCTKKDILPEQKVAEFIGECCDLFCIHAVSASTILLALNIKSRHQFSYWDSLIIAAALEAGCATLHTEDMQRNQIITHTGYPPLTIINPFLQ